MPALLLLARVAAADGTLDLSSPDLLVSTELHGMGGAGIAFATSAGGLGLHPGAAAHRRAEQRRFSGGGATLRAGTIRRDGSPDVGSGWPGTWSALNVSAGFSLLQGPLGAGALVELRRAPAPSARPGCCRPGRARSTPSTCAWASASAAWTARR